MFFRLKQNNARWKINLFKKSNGEGLAKVFLPFKMNFKLIVLSQNNYDVLCS